MYSLKRAVRLYSLAIGIVMALLFILGNILIQKYSPSKHYRFEESHIKRVSMFVRHLNSDTDSSYLIYFRECESIYNNVEDIGLYKISEDSTYAENIADKSKTIPISYTNFQTDEYVKKIKLRNGHTMLITSLYTPPDSYFIVANLSTYTMTTFNKAHNIVRVSVILMIFFIILFSSSYLFLRYTDTAYNIVKGALINVMEGKRPVCLSTYKVTELNKICSIIKKFAVFTRKQNRKLYRISVTDSLTGAYNLRKFYNDIETIRKRSMSQKQGFELLMMDVDNFKHINDTLGHLEGDKVLKNIVAIVKRAIRSGDAIYRYGGDEFTCIMSDTTEESAFQIAERIRKEVEKKTPTTVSIGGSYFFLAKTTREMMREADKKLYIAKSLGRNKSIIIWEDTDKNTFQ